MIAVDSSVLIDLLGEDARADAAEACMRIALGDGRVVVCEVVVSEVTAGLGHGADVMATLQDMGVHFSAVDQTAAIRAGEMQRRYNQRAKDRAPPATTRRTIPDFIVGAHALLQCKALITRDAGFFRDYFKGLRIIVPKAS